MLKSPVSWTQQEGEGGMKELPLSQTRKYFSSIAYSTIKVINSQSKSRASRRENRVIAKPAQPTSISFTCYFTPMFIETLRSGTVKPYWNITPYQLSVRRAQSSWRYVRTTWLDGTWHISWREVFEVCETPGYYGPYFLGIPAIKEQRERWEG